MPTLRIQIRDADIGDLGHVADLWEEMAEHHSRLSHHFTVSEDGKERYSKYLARKFSERSTKLIVATNGERVIGYMLCLLSPNAPVFKEKTIGLVSDVYVRPEFRMRGVAREMLKSGLRWFHKNKVASVQLSVAAENFAARSAWAQLGFKPHMILKRLDMDKYPATHLLSEDATVIRKKVVRKVQKVRRGK